MKRIAFLTVTALLLVPLAARHAADTITVDSSAFVFSPGNWTGDMPRWIQKKGSYHALDSCR